jgi:thymidine kinase
MNPSSYLELFVGCMYAGKTGKLVDIYRQGLFCNLKIMVINYAGDKRYSQTELSTHDKIMIPCIQTETLTHLYIDHKQEIEEADVILINEGQFFSDLYSWVSHLIDNSEKRIYICGLDGDFERRKFGQMLDLIPLCDKITKLTALCSICKNGTPAIHSFRCTNEKGQKVIGNDNYIPLCRKCYKSKNQ